MRYSILVLIWEVAWRVHPFLLSSYFLHYLSETWYVMLLFYSEFVYPTSTAHLVFSSQLEFIIFLILKSVFVYFFLCFDQFVKLVLVIVYSFCFCLIRFDDVVQEFNHLSPWNSKLNPFNQIWRSEGILRPFNSEWFNL